MRIERLINRRKNAISTVAIAAIVVVIAIIAAVGAYIAINSGNTTSSSSSSTSSSATSSLTTSTSATTSAYLGGQQVILTGAGSSLVYPLMSAWTYNYTFSVHSNVKINYASVGSGAGVADITAKTVNFGASDAPLGSAQYGNLSSQGILQIPEIAGAAIPAYNLPGIASGLKFNGTVLAEIYLGNITTWNNSAIAQLNPGVSLPSQSIFVVHRSDGSGTTFVWTDYLSHASAKWNSTVGKGTSVNWPIGFGAKGSEGVSGVIQGNKYSIGYMETAYATADKLTYGAVKNAAGNFIFANSTTTSAAVAAAASEKLPTGSQSWASVSIVDTIFNNATATIAYPITTFTYVIVYQAQTNQITGQALVDFLWWIINTDNKAAGGLGYVPLPPPVVTIDDATISSMTYNGQPIVPTATM